MANLANSLYVTGTSAWGSVYSNTTLQGQKLLIVVKGDKFVYPTTGVPGINEYSHDRSTGNVTFGSAIEDQQPLYFVYRQA